MNALTDKSISILVPITYKRIADLMTTAIEGNHMTRAWCAGILWKGRKINRSKNNCDPWYAMPSLYWRKDFQIEVREAGDMGLFKSHALWPSSISGGLGLMATRHPSHFGDFMSENEDAVTADVFLQLAALGEVRYG